MCTRNVLSSLHGQMDIKSEGFITPHAERTRCSHGGSQVRGQCGVFPPLFVIFNPNSYFFNTNIFFADLEVGIHPHWPVNNESLQLGL